MKALYSACQSTDQKISFAHKLVMTMLPDDYKNIPIITRKNWKQNSGYTYNSGGIRC